MRNAGLDADRPVDCLAVTVTPISGCCCAVATGAAWM
jgi:hypothetical protein